MGSATQGQKLPPSHCPGGSQDDRRNGGKVSKELLD